MENPSEIKKVMQRIASRRRNDLLFVARVASVEGDTCSVSLDGCTLSGVRLRPVTDNSDNVLCVTPATGSHILVADLGGDKRDLVMMACAEAEKIEINGGQLGGLVNIEQLTDKINSLIQTFNTHVHPVPDGTSSAPTVQAQTLQPSDFEDTTILH